jgi:hypothetical protein
MDNKTAYVEKLSAQIVQWNAQPDLLSYKAECTAAGEMLGYNGSSLFSPAVVCSLL